MDTYPGTDLLVRICYNAECQKQITELSDLWVDYDSNCCVCTDCRNAARESYGSERAWRTSILPASGLLGFTDTINELEEG